MKRNVMRTMSLAFAGIMAAGALTACGGNNTAATTAAPAEQTSAAGESAAEEATNTAEPSQSTSSSTSNFGLWWETSVPFAGLEELKNMNAPGSFSR